MKTTKRDWLIPAGLIALSLVPALAGTIRVAELASGAAVTPANARFFAMPLPVMIHVPAAIIYSIVGALQFSPGFRRHNRPWHRAAGKVIALCGFLVALSGLWMAHFYAWPAGDGVGVYVERLIAGSAMLVSLVFALRAIPRRDFSSHGDWMMRAYAIGLGAGTQVLTHLPWFILVDMHPGETPRAVMMGAGWVINVVLAEWVIRRRIPSVAHVKHANARGRRVQELRRSEPDPAYHRGLRAGGAVEGGALGIPSPLWSLTAWQASRGRRGCWLPSSQAAPMRRKAAGLIREPRDRKRVSPWSGELPRSGSGHLGHSGETARGEVLARFPDRLCCHLCRYSFLRRSWVIADNLLQRIGLTPYGHARTLLGRML